MSDAPLYEAWDGAAAAFLVVAAAVEVFLGGMVMDLGRLKLDECVKRWYATGLCISACYRDEMLESSTWLRSE